MSKRKSARPAPPPQPATPGWAARLGAGEAALAGGSALMWYLSFPPAGLWPLAFVALAPLFVLAARGRGWRPLIWAFAGGWAANGACIFWLRHTTWAGMIALAFYVALYWPLAAFLIGWTRRRAGLPLTLAAPVLWVALEFVRSWLLTGFPWVFAGHTQFPNRWLLQTADVGGAHLVSWIVALASGLAADLSLGTWTSPKRRLAWAGGVAVALAAGHVYGAARLGVYRPLPGPRVALVQGNVPQSLKHDGADVSLLKMLVDHQKLSLRAKQADLILWPETMMPVPLNRVLGPQPPAADTWGGLAARMLQEIGRETRAHMLIGALAEEQAPERHFNSAYFLSPQAKLLGRYDKMRLVLYGEYTPLKRFFPFLKALRPPIMGPDLTAGDKRVIFELPWGQSRTSRFGVTICYEDAEAGHQRAFVRQGVDFMANLTNDGWFLDSAELDMHLAVCGFRAVETRRPFVRAANTGISSIVDATGRAVARLTENGKDREIAGLLQGEVPLTDMRSLYVVIGDAFALLLCAAGAGMLVAAWRRTAFEAAGRASS